MKLIECVPNFSEGRDRAVIDAIAASISGTPGAVLLDVDPGAATNRTVVTFVGEPEAVEEAAFRAIKTAAALIDMTRHRGEHAAHGRNRRLSVHPGSGSDHGGVRRDREAGRDRGSATSWAYPSFCTKPQRPARR